MKSTKLSICFNVLLSLITATYACDPAEEGQPYKLKHIIAKVPFGVKMVTWKKDDILVAECPVSIDNCVANDMNWLVAGVIKTDDNITFFLNISSVSRLSLNNAKGIWKLESHTSSPRVEVFYNCNLQVYAKPKETKCTKTWSKDGLTVSCYGRHVYPEAMMSVIRASTDSKTLSCKNTIRTTEPVYYDAECVITFSMQELHLKKEDIIFCIYPNIIGFQNYNQIATNVSMSVLTELSSVYVQECNRTASSISCSCDRLDNDDSKSGFIWYSSGVEVKSKSQLYTATITRDEVEKIWCKPIATKTECNHDVKNIIIYVHITLVVCTSFVILVLCIKYIKCCQPARDLKLPKLNSRKLIFASKNRDDIESTKHEKSQIQLKNTIEGNDSETESIEETTNPTADFVNEDNNIDGEINEAPTLTTMSFYETNKGHSSQTDNTISTETKFNPNSYHVKSSLLLIGTRSRNIELFKSSLLRKSIFTTLITSRKWSMFKKKTKNVHESSENILNAPEIQENNEKKKGKSSKEKNGNKGSSNINLYYSKRDDRVFKLVDGPVYVEKEVDKFKDEMKSCLVLCREGYDAVVVIYTSDKEKDASSLIDTLRENFAFDMNNIILIKTKYDHYREHKPRRNNKSNVVQMQDNCNETERCIDFKGTNADHKFKELFPGRYFGLRLPATDNDINRIFSFVDSMGKANSVSLFVKSDRTLTSNTILESVLRELSLLMEIITKRKNKHQRETEQRFKLLQEMWQKCVDYNVDNLSESGNNVLKEEEELEAIEEEQEETVRESEKEADRQKSEICEDVTYLIKCLHNVYFADQKIERNEEILRPYIMESFQNFHDWYVERIISIKDRVLDSSYKMRLSKKIKIRRHKTI